MAKGAGATAAAALQREKYKLEPLGMLIQSELSFEDWSGLGAWLEVAEQGIQWWIGDWMVYGEQRYGEQYVQAVNATGLALATIKQYQWVCERVPVKNRRSNLSFSHHREVADLPADQQAEWLEKAIKGDDGSGDNPWNTDRLRREIKTEKKGSAKIWVLVTAKDQADADTLIEKFKAEGREAKVR